MSIESLNIENKTDNAAKLLQLQGFPSAEYIKNSEFNEVVGKTNELVEKSNQQDDAIAQLSDAGGKIYNSLTQVLALDPKPADGIAFQISQSTDPTNAGYYSFQSSEPNGIRFDRAFLGLEIEKQSNNLFNKNISVAGYIVSSAGNIIANASGIISSAIVIPDGVTQISLLVGSTSRYIVFYDSEDNKISNQSFSGTSTINLPVGTAKVVFTCKLPTEPTSVLDTIIAVTGNDLGSYYDRIKKLNGSDLLASQIADQAVINTPGNADNSIPNKLKVSEIVNQKLLIEENIVFSDNILNPDLVTNNTSISNTGIITSGTSYNLSNYVACVAGLQYTGVLLSGVNTSLLRRTVFFDNNHVLISGSALDGGHYQFTAPAGAAYFRTMWSNVNNNVNVSITQGNSTDYVAYSEIKEYKTKTPVKAVSDDSIVTRKVLTDELTGLGLGQTVLVNIETSDKILYSGSSSIESFYTPDGKAWVNKLQDFLDYLIVPYGWSGQGPLSIADKFDNDTPTQTANGVKPSEIKPAFVFVGQTLNSDDLLDDADDTAYIEAQEKLVKSAMMRTGGKVIIGTAYRTERRPWIENSLKRIADKYNADFIPFGTYHRSLIRNDKYSGFYGNGHPGIRVADVYTLPLLEYISKMRRAKQAVLLFNARNESDEINDLVVKDNFERAQKFKSIQVGEMSLNSGDQLLYDKLTPVAYGITKNNMSEYMKLLKNNEVLLKDKSLIEFILPTVRNTTAVINIENTGITNVYLLNNKTLVWDEKNLTDNSFSFNEAEYYDYDKVRMLIVGSEVTLTDISIIATGGVQKIAEFSRVMPPVAGSEIISSEGFDDSTVSNYTLGTNVRYNQTVLYGSDFADIPSYLGDSKDVIILTDLLKRSFAITDKESFGYRTLRVWTTCRLNPKIYDPAAYSAWSGGNNPYTDESWYNADKFDYDFMNISVRYLGVTNENLTTSINKQIVGLFWNIGYVDVLLPVVRNGNYQIEISRGSNNNSYDMEVCDIAAELL